MRHPVLSAVWLATVALCAVGIVQRSNLALGLALLVAPLAAIATLAVTARRRTSEPFRRRFAIPYRIVLGILAISSLLGIVGSASSFEHVRMNAPIAIWFLMTLVASWAALARPSPRNAAVPGMVAHVTWIPVVLINVAASPIEVAWADWQQFLVGIGFFVVLALGTVASLFAVFAFVGPQPIASATVRE
jgi:hypothetical protein